MPPLTEAEIFTKMIARQDQDNYSRLILKSSPKLQRSIESRWENILMANSAATDTDIFQIMVQELWHELQNNPTKILVEHWSSFLCNLALAVSNGIFRIVGGQRACLLDIQSICIGLIGSPAYFFQGFNLNYSQSNSLLASLQAYAYRAIRYAAYPAIRKEFDDPNIGRSNLSLFNRYSDVVIVDALLRIGLEPAQQDKYLALCRCTREYLRQNSSTINQLQPDDFDRIGDLYQVITSDLFPPVRDTLEKIGEAIRQATSLRMLSIDAPISLDGGNECKIVDTIAPLNPQPDVYAEAQELQSDWRNICDFWLESNIKTRDRQMLYLRYHFHLKQDVIGLIVIIDQTNISKRLRKINLGLSQALIQQINPESKISPTEILKLVVEMFQENFEQLAIARIDPEHSSILEELIREYRKQASLDLLLKIQNSLEQLWN